MAVLGPGTGLGQAQVLWDDAVGGYRVWPSEGSHATFAPRGWKQRALQARAASLPHASRLSACGVPRVGHSAQPCLVTHDSTERWGRRLGQIGGDGACGPFLP